MSDTFIACKQATMINRLFLAKLVIVLSGFLSVGVVRAASVVWNLEGVTFDDGTVASGFFVFADDTGTYVEIDIPTTSGKESACTRRGAKAGR